MEGWKFHRYGTTIGHKKAKATVVAVDTFLGSSEHYLSYNLRDSVGVGSKDELRLLQIFLDNIAVSKMGDWIIPLPLDSQSAFELLNSRKLEADLIHIDAGHHYFSVYFDLVSWWSLLKPGGYLVCDDYSSAWPGVVRAVYDFRKVVEHDNFETDNTKCSFRKIGTDDQSAPEVDMNSIVVSHAIAEIARYQYQVADLNHKLQEVEGSLSWKLTSPLRAILAQIRRFRFRYQKVPNSV